MKQRALTLVLALCLALGHSSPAQSGIKDLLNFKKRREDDKVRQELIATCIETRSWMAYFKNDEGAVSPVRDTLNTEEDEDWLGLQFTDYDGPRIRLGVLKVVNKSAKAEERGYADDIAVEVAGIQEMLTVALFNTKRFDVIEQKRIDEVQAQQTRKDVIDSSPGAILNMGKVLGAQYLVYGTVNEWSGNRGRQSVGPGGVFSGSKQEGELSVTFVLTDVSSGQTLFTTIERARMGEWSFNLGGGQGTEQKAPVNYSVRACANKAALKIANFLRNRKWKGSIVELKGSDIYINAGSQQGMTPGTLLSVQSVLGIIRDGESGTILGEDTKGIGSLEVISVQTGFSIARIVEGCKAIKKGDRVELATPPQSPQPAPGCAQLDPPLAM